MFSECQSLSKLRVFTINTIVDRLYVGLCYRGPLPVLKLQGPEAVCRPPCHANVQNYCRYIIHVPPSVFIMCTRTTLPLLMLVFIFFSFPGIFPFAKTNSSKSMSDWAVL
jgi:hypothetical protein